MFDWFKFVEEAEVVLLSEMQVKHLIYKGINVCHYKCGVGLFVGAYKYRYESEDERRTIQFIEENGITIHGIVSAIEEGLQGLEKPSLDLAQYIDNGNRLLKKAFEKGLSLQAEAKEVFKKEL